MKKYFTMMLSCILTLALLLSLGCRSFAETVTLPQSLTTIGAEAFKDDASLDEVVIPASVRHIDDSAFTGTNPVFYLEDPVSFSGNLNGRGTVHLMRDVLITNPVSFTNTTLIIDAGVTVTVNSSLEGSRLIINGVLVNRGAVRVTERVETGRTGVLFILEDGTQTEIPAASYYSGLHVRTGSGAQITLTGTGGSTTIRPIFRGETSAEIVNGGDIVRFCFVPDVSGSYTLTSKSNEDTFVDLCDAGGNKLKSNDDDGENRNFSITYDFVAHTVYYFDVRYYFPSQTGTIPLVLSANFHDAEITSQPDDVVAAPGSNATFRVAATGSDLTYQWQLMLPEDDVWQDIIGADADTLVFPAQDEYDGWQFRCQVTGSDGIPVFSDAVFLYVTADTVHYRALLISEVSFSWETCTRNEGDVRMMKTMLQSVKGETGSRYSIAVRKDLTPAQVHTAINETFGAATNTDVSLFFIATHGDIMEGPGSARAGELYTYDDDSITFGTLASWLSAVPGKVIVIVESCGSGASIYANGKRAEPSPASDEQFAQALIDAFAALDTSTEAIRSNTGELRVSDKFYVLTAAALQQESWGYEYNDPDTSYNLFTKWLTEGVGTGGAIPADSVYGNRDGIVTLEELYSYISAVGDNYGIYSSGYTYYQTVKRYPEGSNYRLFRR